MDSVPAGVSKIWLQQILRTELGFEGLIISDDLSMEGIVGSGDYRTRGELALEAGCNILLACNNRAGAIELLQLDAPVAESIAHRMQSMLGHHAVDSSTLKSSSRWKIASNNIKNIEF